MIVHLLRLQSNDSTVAGRKRRLQANEEEVMGRDNNSRVQTDDRQTGINPEVNVDKSSLV